MWFSLESREVTAAPPQFNMEEIDHALITQVFSRRVLYGCGDRGFR
jgi:hypothetical protein